MDICVGYMRTTSIPSPYYRYKNRNVLHQSDALHKMHVHIRQTSQKELNKCNNLTETDLN